MSLSSPRNGAQILEGKPVADAIFERVSAHAKGLRYPPQLVAVVVGKDPASHTYVKSKAKQCEKLGFVGKTLALEGDTREEDLYRTIEELNQDPRVNGILVQLPLPKHLSPYEVALRIDPLKDVDGLHPRNVGLLWQGRTCLVPCTPAGVIEMLKFYKIPLEGKTAVVMGRSEIVGKPMAQLLLRENCTVTVCHSKTKQIESITTQADILVAAIGQPRFVGKKFVKPGAVVIDVGIHRVDGNLVGDVDFDEVRPHCGAISPVPGGVGKMTIAMLMNNLVIAARSQDHSKR